MTESAPRRRAPAHPALASRILALGASIAAMLGLIGAMASRAPVEEGIAAPTPSVRPRPVRIVVVVRRSTPSPQVRRATSARRAPRIVRRYVRRRGGQARTVSRGS